VGPVGHEGPQILALNISRQIQRVDISRPFFGGVLFEMYLRGCNLKRGVPRE
jgi:hypothetical protein